ncbi:MAG: hypothetical protein JW788_06355 [Candidatus Omnitrophica bacterium]|nr:hypothetical protein [Candidatus Omnitrophota bacterium]
MKKIISFLIVISALNLALPAFAQIRLERFNETLKVSPGQNIKGSIVLSSDSNETVDLRVYLQDVKFIPPFTGKKDFLPPGSTPYSCSNWITVTPGFLSIPPKGKKIVSYSINVPQDVKGWHCATIFFEKGAVALSGNNNVGVIERWGYTLFLENKEGVKKAEVGEFLGSGRRQINGTVVNTGETILIAAPDFSVMNDKGRVIDEGNIQQIFIPPGETAAIQMELTPKIHSGVDYTLVIKFDFFEGKPLTKKIKFSSEQGKSLKILSVE